ncbi:MAG: RNA polymerase subunit sigma-24 [Planctomycetota bacterium]|nr:MAG: RNA polymerase subunit sigma-24 [Planctomycetota bacterium]
MNPDVTRPEDRHAEFCALLAPERDALWRFARRMSWDASSAEDALQDAILVAWRKFDVFTPGTSFRAWTFRILSNTILNANNQLRRNLARQVLSENLDLVSALEKEDAYDKVLEDPEALLAQVGDEVRGAVKSLPPAERMVFLLRSVEGFAYKEISAALEIPMGTVMSHLFRARARLREFLAEYVQQTGFVRTPTS